MLSVHTGVDEKEAQIVRDVEDKFNVYCMKDINKCWHIQHISYMANVDDDAIEFLLDKGFSFIEYRPTEDNDKVMEAYMKYEEKATVSN